MDSYIPLREDIFWVGANDRYTSLFEGLWPLPHGVCYNSYVILDEKTALMDTVKVQSEQDFLGKVKGLIKDGRKLDYLIVNHMEPDHSGAIQALLSLWPELIIIGNEKTARFLESFYGITNNVQVIKGGDTLSLGKHVLQFHLIPMVHWPETMVTYDTTDKILFSADAFGGFGAMTGGIFDDELDLDFYEDEILRYFSNIVGKYSMMVQKAIAKLGGLDIQMIAPTHGPIWRTNPGHIIEKYDRWSRHEAERGVALIYGSMYGNTEKMMEAVARGLSEEDVSRVRIHNVSTTHLSFLIRDAWRYKGLILGGPTYDTGLFPPMQFLIDMLQRKMLRNRTLGLFGSFTWSGGGVNSLVKFAEEGSWNLIEPVVECRSCPTAIDINQCVELGRNIAKAIKA
ncbi:FprA family A-type flavoprotein [Tichowtungia aerotolerans]|uniref:MBL fold metallo-hydrolase n=1 Tax=Tichowtungia aerotolerans TaxID=2697043 RepID=A0A6P1MBL8_9BACT|nr:FprA family A-type flavoprotein [Tichowtungia aerotolerans]QHI68966.1 MBL fold metallo-hydrolase [Tichowtungia aerotolerans]